MLFPGGGGFLAAVVLIVGGILALYFFGIMYGTIKTTKEQIKFAEDNEIPKWKALMPIYSLYVACPLKRSFFASLACQFSASFILLYGSWPNSFFYDGNLTMEQSMLIVFAITLFLLWLGRAFVDWSPSARFNYVLCFVVVLLLTMVLCEPLFGFSIRDYFL